MEEKPFFANGFEIIETPSETIIKFTYTEAKSEIIVSRMVLNNATAQQLTTSLSSYFSGKTSGPKYSPATKTKILIVEDNTTYRDELVDFLNRNNFETYSTVNGDAAIKMAQQFHPDIILMDHIMPVLNGLDAARIIKQTSTFKNTKIFLLIGYGKISDFAEEEHIIQKVLHKPINYEELIKELSA